MLHSRTPKFSDAKLGSSSGASGHSRLREVSKRVRYRFRSREAPYHLLDLHSSCHVLLDEVGTRSTLNTIRWSTEPLERILQSSHYSQPCLFGVLLSIATISCSLCELRRDLSQDLRGKIIVRILRNNNEPFIHSQSKEQKGEMRRQPYPSRYTDHVVMKSSYSPHSYFPKSLESWRGNIFSPPSLPRPFPFSLSSDSLIQGHLKLGNRSHDL